MKFPNTTIHMHNLSPLNIKISYKMSVPYILLVCACAVPCGGGLWGSWGWSKMSSSGLNFSPHLFVHVLWGLGHNLGHQVVLIWFLGPEGLLLSRGLARLTFFILSLCDQSSLSQTPWLKSKPWGCFDLVLGVRGAPVIWRSKRSTSTVHHKCSRYSFLINHSLISNSMFQSPLF